MEWSSFQETRSLAEVSEGLVWGWRQGGGSGEGQGELTSRKKRCISIPQRATGLANA